MIDKLTSEQEELALKYREIASKLALTGKEVYEEDRAKCEGAVQLAYECAGLDPDVKVTWRDSHIMSADLGNLPNPVAYDNVFVNTINEVKDRVKQKCNMNVRSKIERILRTPGEDMLAPINRTVHLDRTRNTLYGSQMAPLIMYYDYYSHLGVDTSPLLGLVELTKQNVWLKPHRYEAYVCPGIHTIKLNDMNQLHSDDGTPALEICKRSWYAVEGQRIEENYGKVPVMDWEAEWIVEEPNATTKQILIRQIGYDRILDELGGKVISKWKEYELVKFKNINDDYDNTDAINRWRAPFHPMLILKMTCPSTGMIHAHRVPPDMNKAREAAKWINRGIGDFKKQT